jgi:hypothetical protein
MKATKLFLKLAILMIGLITLHAATAQSQVAAAALLCRIDAVLCTTDSSSGHCGYEYGEDCKACYGDDGSMLLNSPDCL